jgi:hypothetical protein
MTILTDSLMILSHCSPGLSDGTFSNQKSQFGKVLEGLGMEKVCIFCGHLEYITAMWCIFWPFGKLVSIWYIFPVFGKVRQEKSGNPAVN